MGGVCLQGQGSPQVFVICKAIEGLVDAGKSAEGFGRQQAQDLHEKFVVQGPQSPESCNATG